MDSVELFYCANLHSNRGRWAGVLGIFGSNFWLILIPLYISVSYLGFRFKFLWLYIECVINFLIEWIFTIPQSICQTCMNDSCTKVTSFDLESFYLKLWLVPFVDAKKWKKRECLDQNVSVSLRVKDWLKFNIFTFFSFIIIVLDIPDTLHLKNTLSKGLDCLL